MIKKVIAQVIGGNLTQPEQRIRVLMVTASGQQFLLNEELFYDRHGRDLSFFSRFAKLQTALKRMLKNLLHDVSATDWEILRPTNMGRRRTWFVVWFPPKDAFDEAVIAHDHNYALLSEDYFLNDQRKLAALRRLVTEAVSRRKDKITASKPDPTSVA